MFFFLVVILNYSEGYNRSDHTFQSDILPSLYNSLFSFQIQNADDVLITPLEKFRKEQIGAAKVKDHLYTQLAIEQQRVFHVF